MKDSPTSPNAISTISGDENRDRPLTVQCLLSRSPLDLQSPSDSLARYCRKIRSLCSPLAVSAQQGKLFVSKYEFSSTLTKCDPSMVGLEIYLVAISYADQLLKARAVGVPNSQLSCDNLVLRFSSNIQEETAGFRGLDLAHWALRERYASAGLMFGKFRRGEDRARACRRGVIPAPPETFLSIRFNMGVRDDQFFRHAEHLLAEARDKRANERGQLYVGDSGFAAVDADPIQLYQAATRGFLS